MTLAYDIVRTGEFTYELRDKATAEKVNICDRFYELEAQGHFDAKKGKK